MSKLLIIPLSAAVMFASAIVSPADAAEVCATAPTCAELGYTLTSTANCVGTPLKCPFDKTKYYCTTKQEAAAAATPDYSKAESRSLNNTYKASTDGFIYGVEARFGSCGSYNGNVQILINGANIRGDTWVYGHHYLSSFYFPIKKGTTYNITSNYAHGDCFSIWYKFIPLD